MHPVTGVGADGYKNGEASIRKFFNHEREAEGSRQFGKRRLPHVMLSTAASYWVRLRECITWEPFKEGFLCSGIARPAVVRTAAPTKKQMINTRTSESSVSADSHSVSS
jgi:hypothetical protein